MARRTYVERVPGWRFRTRELRPLPGEHRRWLVVLNGEPYCIKRTVRHFVDVARYRGVASSLTEAVFVWARPETRRAA